jgi:hypothetical protein
MLVIRSSYGAFVHPCNLITLVLEGVANQDDEEVLAAGACGKSVVRILPGLRESGRAWTVGGRRIDENGTRNMSKSAMTRKAYRNEHPSEEQ